jgi:hypothetical protein
MRKLVFMLTMVMAMALGQATFAQVVGVGANEKPLTAKEKAEASSKAAVEKVLKFAQVRNYEGLGKMTVYAGREPNRAMRSKLNLYDAYERVENENTCNLIHKILEQSVIWNPTNFKIVNSVNEKYYYWDVEFTDEKTKTKVYSMLFVELSGEMLFARIEKKGTVKTE